MSHKFSAQHADGLIAPRRYQELKPDILLQRLATPPGSTLLDLGCGNGFFTFPAAAAMGQNGMVIAADISEQMLKLLDRRMPPDNVQILQVEEITLDIESGTVDAAVLITLFHEFKQPQENLKEIQRVLKSGGKLMVLDWDPLAEQQRGPVHDHRVQLDTAVEQLVSAGYTIDSRENYIEDMWMILAHSPE